MDFDVLKRAIDLQAHDICDAATRGQIDELIEQLKPHINPFDYNNITQMSRPSHRQMSEIIDLVQKGKRAAKEVFLGFLNRNNPESYVYIIEKAQPGGAMINSPSPEVNFARFAYNYTSPSNPRLSSGDDSPSRSSLDTITVNANGLDTQGASAPSNPTDVHSTVNRSSLFNLTKFKSAVKIVFESLDDSEISGFEQWLIEKQFIERGTLSRCIKWDDLMYELEKRENLGAFAEYREFPSTDVVNDMQYEYRQIQKFKCKTCNKRLLTLQ